MIFKTDREYNQYYGELIIHVAIFISISLSLLSSNSIMDFILLTCMIIYLSKGSKIHWHFPLLIFLWGIYSDLVIGYPIGYSSTLFLFFLLLNRVSNYFGIFHINNVRFFLFSIGLLLVLTCEQLIIYLNFSSNISFFLQILKILTILVLYFPINFFIKKQINFNE